MTRKEALDAVTRSLEALAPKLEKPGRRANWLTREDMAVLMAEYRRRVGGLRV